MTTANPQQQKPRGFRDTMGGIFGVLKNISKPGINRSKVEIGAAVATENPAAILGAVQDSAAQEIALNRQKEEQKAQEKSEKERLKALRNSGKSVGGPGGGSSGGEGKEPILMWLLFLLALIIHIVDMNTQYDVLFNWPIMTGYLIILFLGMMGIFKKQYSDDGLLFGAVMAGYFLPRLVRLLFMDVKWQFIILGFLCFMPIVALLFVWKSPSETKLKKLGMLYFYGWIIIMLIWLMIMMGQNTEFNMKTSGVVPIDAGKSFAKGIWDAGKIFVGGFMTPINNLMCPECGANAEDNERGIYLENLRSTDSTYYTGSDVFVQGKLRAKNINGSIKVNTLCYVPGEKQGIVTPAAVSLTYNDENYLDCQLGQLSAGSKEVKFVSSFEYQTDAWITYTFMDTNTLNALNMQNDELYTKLNIPRKAVATYTGGPVEIGLPQLSQPFRIDPKDPNSVTYPFGVSLTNKWTQGKIVKGLYYRLEVPITLTLQNCNRKISKYEKTEDANIYTFSIDDANVRETFDSVTCRMYVDEANVDKLLGNDIKSIKTFNAKVRYLYSIEQSIYVNIEKI